MMTRPFDSKDRLSKILTRLGAWLRGHEQAKPSVGIYQQSSQLAQPPDAHAAAPARQAPTTGAPIRRVVRSTISSEQYGSATIVARMRPARTENFAYPSPVTYKQSWTYPSSVDPIPVWYRVAGYEDKAQKPK